MFIVILIILIIFVIIVVSALNQADKEMKNNNIICKEISQKRLNCKDFLESSGVFDMQNLFYFAVDETNRKILYITKEQTLILDFSEVISVELIENNITISSRSLGRTIGGAVIGGVIAGGAGTIVGGLSGNQKSKTRFSSLQVKITLRNISSPILLINCFDSKQSCAQDSITSESVGYKSRYLPALENANKIVNILKVVIDKVEKENDAINTADISCSTSVADELMKLADLKNKGIISEEEFNSQKNKLLS